ncbi:MAG: hypothetical protein DHS20C13_22180 [Thermodesulfobacteriota bacterium]|nr:MAG: hypothetical protein DHS20C13_22180 [Thermodesulfobacteriota bacterium]GJM35915.1 MAG: hypothetical protein DHS20C18_49160 [Saprospiraceae bacterium]
MAEEEQQLPSEKEVKQYFVLMAMLAAQKKELDLLSRKKPDEALNPRKVMMVNRVLKPLNEIMKHEPSYPFLDVLDDSELPTNSDVVLIISQYEKAIYQFRGKYFVKDEYLRISRWMTIELPPDYYKDREDEFVDDNQDDKWIF